MDLSSVTSIKSLLRKHKISPSKKFGQNFLIDKSSLRKVITTAGLNPDETVLEVGPGLGVLTQELAEKAKRVVAVEKDPKMVAMLKETLKDYKNIEIIQENILKLQNQIPKHYKIVANLPFYLTAPVIRQFLESAEDRPQQMILIVQKEVGQRICSKVPRMNLLAVSVQVYAKVEIIDYISKKSFWPQPKVDAAIIKITPLKRLLRPGLNKFFLIVKAGFSQPRKQLINNLSKSLKLSRARVKEWLKKNSIQPTQRAETLTVKDWIKLTKSIKI